MKKTNAGARNTINTNSTDKKRKETLSSDRHTLDHLLAPKHKPRAQKEENIQEKEKEKESAAAAAAAAAAAEKNKAEDKDKDKEEDKANAVAASEKDITVSCIENVKRILQSTTLKSLAQQMKMKEDHTKHVSHNSMAQMTLARAKKTKNKLIANGNIIQLSSSDTMEYALQTLSKYNILSAPVIVQNSSGLNSLETSDGERSTCLGFFSVWDCVDPIIRAIEEEKTSGLEKMNMLRAMEALNRVATKVFNNKVIQIEQDDVDLIFAPFAQEMSVFEAMDLFLGNHHQLVHRIAVFDTHGEIQEIISQSDIIRFLQLKDEIGTFPELSRLTIENVGFCSQERMFGLCVVEPQELTIDVLKKMKERNISCVGVVYEDCLIANFSVSDLRRITREHLSVLALPIAEFLAVSHKTSYGGYSHIGNQHLTHAFFQSMNEGSPTAVDQRNLALEKDEIRLQAVHINATISDVLKALTNCHRCWVIDERSGKPLDVITLTDILRIFVNKDAFAFGGKSASG